jgi:DNA-binding transcriptional MerR regulator
MIKEHYLLRDVAKLLGVKPYQIAYALSVELVPEPELRISNKRIFQQEDIERLAAHFKVELGGKPTGKTVTCKEDN